MVGPDPLLVEVKAGGKLDQRGKKQARNLEQLHELFKTDRAVSLRGIPEIRRVEHPESAQTYLEEMNACIETAVKNGAAIINPEPRVYYAALIDDGAPMVEVLGRLNVKQPRVYFLNERKAARAWAP
jgi:hypothetical protein